MRAAAAATSRMVDLIRDALIGRFTAIVDSVKQKVEAVTGFFANMYDAAVAELPGIEPLARDPRDRFSSARALHDAVDAFLSRQGVCRDFAHLVVALLRARNVPARVVAGYAPGLRPMDFHAVAEAWMDGQWHLLDATRLSDTGALVRVSTGADSSDTAFLSTVGGSLSLKELKVTAVVDDFVPETDPAAGVQQG